MNFPLVSVNQGQLRGDIGYDFKGGLFYKFLGIPYAKPPVGKLRFKAPELPDPWKGVRDATKDGEICFSRDFSTGNLEGSEDCLILNVFTKQISDNKNLQPVMVFIHGGAFTMGSSKTDYCGPDYLMTEDIVLVTINYRLGILGFISLEDTSLEVYGNAGLKDQTMALRWVQENIKNFGGDPNNVTIFGESAGSASVDYQILSPTSKGLFHKAILQSGVALNPWSHGSRNAIEIVEKLGKIVTNEADALKILIETPVKELYEAQLKFQDNLASLVKRPFGPVIEKPNPTAFLTQDPLEILSKGNYNKVPIIFGYTSREGMLIEIGKIFNNEHSKLMPDHEEITPETALTWPFEDKNRKETVNMIREMYFNTPDKVDGIYQLLTDSMFLLGIIITLKYHLKTNPFPVYLYRMSIESEFSLTKIIGQVTRAGASHGDDLCYILKQSFLPEVKVGSFEEMAITRFVKLWTNFARNGNPTPLNEFDTVWESVKNEESIKFLDIGDKLTAQVNPEPERMELWTKILSKVSMKFS